MTANALNGIAAEALGAELARSVRERSGPPADGIVAFASAMSLNPERVQDELAYLSIVTMHFCIGAAIEDEPLRLRVAGGFYHTLWSGAPWRASAGGLETRTLEYETALNNPHPELGRAYGLGRGFARQCAAAQDVPVIEFGARAYVEQLSPILSLLRSVTIV